MCLICCIYWCLLDITLVLLCILWFLVMAWFVKLRLFYYICFVFVYSDIGWFISYNCIRLFYELGLSPYDAKFEVLFPFCIPTLTFTLWFLLFKELLLLALSYTTDYSFEPTFYIMTYWLFARAASISGWSAIYSIPSMVGLPVP